MRVFITDGNQRPALAIARSLGRRGLTVLVGEQTPRSLASSSKYCHGHFTYPSPEHEPKAFERFLLALARRGDVDVIVPVTDVAMHAVAANQDALKHYCDVACPPFAAFGAASDKWALLQRARACGVPVPQTLYVRRAAELRDVAGVLTYPVVAKSTRSRLSGAAGWIRTGVHYAASRDELERLFADVEYLRDHPSLIQQRIVGPGVAIFGLFDRGELLTAFAHRRLREKPPSGGASVLSESVAVDPRLRDYAVRLLGPLGWHGVAMLEFKQDAETGTPYLMEINGRFWGSLELAIAAGVDFPHLSVELAAGRRPEAPAEYRVGVKNRWLLGDLDCLLLRLAHSSHHLRLPDSAPSRLRSVLEFLEFSAPDLHYEIVSADDPGPFAFELRQYFRDAAAGVRRQIARTLVPGRFTASGVRNKTLPALRAH